LTIHIRERQANGLLLGILVDDRRDPKERSTFLAEQGEIIKSDRGAFLVLENGSVQRRTADQRDPTLVLYDRYAFDLSHLGGGPTQIQYSVREMYPWELLAPEPTAAASQREKIRAEIYDRIAGPIYPLVFVVIAFAYLGIPRTTRQSRTMSLVGAIGATALLRVIGFASVIFGTYVPAALFAQYVALAIALGLGLLAISRGTVIEPPAFLSNALSAINERVARRMAAT
jgi:lipopolysaccharide export system permease protein